MAKRAKTVARRVYAKAKTKARRIYVKVKRRISKAKPSLLIMIPTANKAIIDPALIAFPFLQSGDIAGAFTGVTDTISRNFTGYTPSTGAFNLADPLDTYKQIALGYAGHKIVTKLGVNRYFKQIPMIGKMFRL